MARLFAARAPSLFISLIVPLALIAVGPAALADDALLPTDLRAYGDCVTPRILAPTNAVQSKIDREDCVDGNLGDTAGILACLRNTSYRQEVTFFTDSCGSEDGPFEISLGGTTHTLTKVKRQKADRVPVAGIYQAPGLDVSIAPGRLLRRSAESLAEGGNESYEVFVTVRRGASVKRIRGVFWHGH